MTLQLHPFLAALGLAALLGGAAPALAAGDDHGHDHGSGAAAVGGAALPRFAAVSDAFELVGVLDGRRVTLYLDRAADNAPVDDARIEIDIGGARLQARAVPGQQPGDAAFEVVLAGEPAAGLLPVTATVTVGDEIDLLAGEFDIHAAAPAGETAQARAWTLRHAGWIAGAGAAVAVVLVIGRRMAAARQRRAGGAA